MHNVEVSAPLVSKADVLSLFQRLLPVGFWDALQRQTHLHPHNCVYTATVVTWLMVSQWIQGHAPLQDAVLELLSGLPADFWPRPCKRLRTSTPYLSSNTAAYNNARQRLPQKLVESCCDHIFEQLTEQTEDALPRLDRRAFFFDGTSVDLPSTPALRESYPPGSNQFCQSHWPLLRMLVAHDLQTGLAMRPQWGPANGEHAVSEQQLLESGIDRLPDSSLIVGDANFGVFSVAYAVHQRGHLVLLRLTQSRALRLAGGPLCDGIDRVIRWTPTRSDRRSHPNLPKHAAVPGRLVVCRVQPSNEAKPFLLAMFTTWTAAVPQVTEVYGQRYNIETDLRSLKSTLHLEQLRCTSEDMIAKELDLAMAAYNLIRAVIYQAAQRAGLPPRAYSFARVAKVINAFLPLLTNAKTPEQARSILAKIEYYTAQALLPKRTRKRPPYPRAVWTKPHSFPYRKE